MSEIEIQDYDFRAYKSDMNKIFSQVTSEKRPYDLIVGLERGGVIPITHLAYKMNMKPLILNWSQVERDETQRQILELLALQDQKILVFDDIIDSGETLSTLGQGVIGEMIDIACLVWNKSQNLVTPKYHGREIFRDENKKYIRFWWEK